MNAIDVLKGDRQTVIELFQEFSAGGRDRESLARKICDELEVHAAIEEEIFYPAVRKTGDQELERQVDESIQEHQRMKEQVHAIQSRLEGRTEGEGEELEPQVTALEQDVEHHVEEEESEMFPRLEETMDRSELDELGRRLEERKQAHVRRGAASKTRSGRRRRAARTDRKSAGGNARTTRAKSRSTGPRGAGSRSRSKTKRQNARGKTKTSSGRKRARGGGRAR